MIQNRRQQTAIERIIRLLDGRKTILLVVSMIAITVHLIYSERLESEWGMIFIAAELLPLAMNHRKTRQHREVLTELNSLKSNLRRKK